MPGPGKSKSKSKPKVMHASPSTVTVAVPESDPLVRSIDDAEGWNMVVNTLCKVFELPGVLFFESAYLIVGLSSSSDLNTRSGLKKVHANFELISRRLDAEFKKNMGNEKIRGGIIGIYAKMCVDSILRDKLFRAGQDGGLISLVITCNFSEGSLYQDFYRN